MPHSEGLSALAQPSRVRSLCDGTDGHLRLGGDCVSWHLFNWFDNDYGPGSSVIGVVAPTLGVAFIA